jgi:hypothetical protein
VRKSVYQRVAKELNDNEKILASSFFNNDQEHNIRTISVKACALVGKGWLERELH